jgi:hypothetical protein
MCSLRLARLSYPRGSRGGRYRVAHDLLYAGVVQSTRTLLHKALVADEHGNENAWANVAVAPCAEAARALCGQGGVTGRGWKADLVQALTRRGLMPILEEGLWSSVAPGGAAAAAGAGGASVNTFQHINPYRVPPCYRHAIRRRHMLARPFGSGGRRRRRSPWRGRRRGPRLALTPGERRGGRVGGVAKTA